MALLQQQHAHHSLHPVSASPLSRCGRAARAGRPGSALSLLTRDELPYLLDLHLFLSRQSAPAPLSPDQQLVTEAAAAMAAAGGLVAAAAAAGTQKNIGLGWSPLMHCIGRDSGRPTMDESVAVLCISSSGCISLEGRPSKHAALTHVLPATPFLPAPTHRCCQRDCCVTLRHLPLTPFGPPD